MHCYICDSQLSEIHFNSDHKDIEPCPTCLAVIQDTVGSWTDKPFADEDDFAEAPFLPLYMYDQIYLDKQYEG